MLTVWKIIRRSTTKYPQRVQKHALVGIRTAVERSFYKLMIMLYGFLNEDDHQPEFAIRPSVHLRYQHLPQYMITDLAHQFHNILRIFNDPHACKIHALAGIGIAVERSSYKLMRLLYGLMNNSVCSFRRRPPTWVCHTAINAFAISTSAAVHDYRFNASILSTQEYKYIFITFYIMFRVIAIYLQCVVNNTLLLSYAYHTSYYTSVLSIQSSNSRFIYNSNIREKKQNKPISYLRWQTLYCFL